MERKCLSPVIVALDFATECDAFALVSQLSPELCRVKVGMQLFTSLGPDFIKRLCKRGFDVFLDLKFHDIPNTVRAAVSAACELGVWMVNVHAQGGLSMLQAAREAVNTFSGNKPILMGVTVLTSLEQADLLQLGYTGLVQDNVLCLAGLVHQAGLDGVVCSAQEAKLLRDRYGSNFVLVTPGIRLQGSHDDQKRVVTPSQAISDGANYLIMGREITQADDPVGMLQALRSNLQP